ncbi:MAG: T9SS type A sorting domain-containing protein [Bacteroidia bacterium]
MKSSILRGALIIPLIGMFLLSPGFLFGQIIIGQHIDHRNSSIFEIGCNKTSVAIDSVGNSIMLGDPCAAAVQNGQQSLIAGSSHVYSLTTNNWVVEHRIGSYHGPRYQGQSVCLSGDGNRYAMGADGAQHSFGHVYIYDKRNGNWFRRSTIVSPDRDALLGHEIALSEDGNMLAVGSPGDHDFTGKVAVYSLTGGSHTQIGQDIVGDFPLDNFGDAIAISADGKRLAIGAPGHSQNGYSLGSVRIFEYVNGAWIQMGNDLKGHSSGEAFGRDVSISGDGTTLVVGAPFREKNGKKLGGISIFHWVNGSWAPSVSAFTGNRDMGLFGWSVSIAKDGKAIAVGAPKSGYESTRTWPSTSPNLPRIDTFFAGQIELFSSKSGTWKKYLNTIEPADIYSSRGSPHHYNGSSLGYDVALSANGNKLIASSGSYFKFAIVYDLETHSFPANNVSSSTEEPDLITIFPSTTNTQNVESSALRISDISVYDVTGRQIVAQVQPGSDSWTVATQYNGVVILKIQTDQGLKIRKVVFRD